MGKLHKRPLRYSIADVIMYNIVGFVSMHIFIISTFYDFADQQIELCNGKCKSQNETKKKNICFCMKQ